MIQPSKASHLYHHHRSNNNNNNRIISQSHHLVTNLQRFKDFALNTMKKISLLNTSTANKDKKGGIKVQNLIPIELVEISQEKSEKKKSTSVSLI